MPEPCIVHGEKLILCASCEAERLIRIRMRIADSFRRATANYHERVISTHYMNEIGAKLDRVLEKELR